MSFQSFVGLKRSTYLKFLFSDQNVTEKFVSTVKCLFNPYFCSRSNDVCDEMFFIQRGDVAIMDDDDTTILKVLGPGQHFNEVQTLINIMF